MPNFCTYCRFPLTPGVSFCPQCGRQLGVAQNAPAAPVATSGGGSSAIKILLIVVVCLGVLGVGAIAAGYYMVHRVKEAVVAKAESYGINPSSIPSPIPTSSASHSKVYKPCEMLPKGDASNLLAEPIERAEMVDGSCMYYGPAGLAEKLASQNTAEMMNQARSGAKLNGGDVADTVTKMMGAAAAKSGENGAKGGDVPLLTLLIDPDGRPQMTAVATSKNIFGGIGAGSGGGGLGSNIPNLGDQAILLGPLGLNVLKGDTLIRVIVGPVPGAKEKSVAIARALLPRI